MVERQVQSSVQEVAREKLRGRACRKDPWLNEPGGSLYHESLSKVQPSLFEPDLFTHGLIERLKIIQIDSVRLRAGVIRYFLGVGQAGNGQPIGLKAFSTISEPGERRPHASITTLND